MNSKPDRPQYLLGTAAALIFAALFMACWLLDSHDVDFILSLVK